MGHRHVRGCCIHMRGLACEQTVLCPQDSPLPRRTSPLRLASSLRPTISPTAAQSEWHTVVGRCPACTLSQCHCESPRWHSFPDTLHIATAGRPAREGQAPVTTTNAAQSESHMTVTSLPCSHSVSAPLSKSSLAYSASDAQPSPLPAAQPSKGMSKCGHGPQGAASGATCAAAGPGVRARAGRMRRARCRPRHRPRSHLPETPTASSPPAMCGSPAAQAENDCEVRPAGHYGLE